jgi:peptide/nickel transport system permease protein
MLRYLLRRISLIPPALLLVHFLGFAYAHIVRPLRAFRNPFLAATSPPSPLLTTYADLIRKALNFDFGNMPDPWGINREITIPDGVFRASASSLGLLGIALLVSVMVGVYLGFRAARSEPPIVARWLTVLSTTGLAMPTFLTGSLFFAAWFLYVLWGGPGSLPLPLSGFGWDAHLIIPVLVLMARPSVQIAQVTASLLTEEFGKQYVVAARSVGNTWRAIRSRHALRNMMAPLILTIASSVRLLVGELIIVEWLFDWPGLGSLLAQTLIPGGIVLSRRSLDNALFLDPPVIAAALVIFAALFLATDLMASLLVRVFDPRIRED